MTSWRWALLSLCGLVVVGCQVDPRLAMLEQECRQLEDRLFRQQATLDQYQTALERCQKSEGSDEGLSSEIAPRNLPKKKPRKNWESDQGSKQPEGTVLEPPVVELPTESIPHEIIETPDPLPSPDNLEPPDRLPDDDTGEPPKWTPTTDKTSDTQPIARIVLIDQITGGQNLDHRPGDEAVSVGIQPQTDQGRLVKLAAPVSVVVLDRALRGDAARVGRWDFTAKEVAQSVRLHDSSEAIYLEMLWPDDSPNHHQLRLHVRYFISDKQHLDAVRDFEINVPGRSLAELQGVSPRQGRAPHATDAVLEHNNPPIRVAERTSIPSPAMPPKKTFQRPVWSPNRR